MFPRPRLYVEAVWRIAFSCNLPLFWKTRAAWGYVQRRQVLPTPSPHRLPCVPSSAPVFSLECARGSCRSCGHLPRWRCCAWGGGERPEDEGGSRQRWQSSLLALLGEGPSWPLSPVRAGAMAPTDPCLVTLLHEQKRKMACGLCCWRCSSSRPREGLSCGFLQTGGMELVGEGVRRAPN